MVFADNMGETLRSLAPLNCQTLMISLFTITIFMLFPRYCVIFKSLGVMKIVLIARKLIYKLKFSQYE